MPRQERAHLFNPASNRLLLGNCKTRNFQFLSQSQDVDVITDGYALTAMGRPKKLSRYHAQILAAAANFRAGIHMYVCGGEWAEPYYYIYCISATQHQPFRGARVNVLQKKQCSFSQSQSSSCQHLPQSCHKLNSLSSFGFSNGFRLVMLMA